MMTLNTNYNCINGYWQQSPHNIRFTDFCNNLICTKREIFIVAYKYETNLKI